MTLQKSMVVAAILFAVVSACNDDKDNFIDGSLVKNYHISYDGVRARLYSTDLSVEYMSDSIEGVAALRVTIYTDGLVLAAGKTYDLVKYGSVTRYDELGSLPELQSGELTLDTFSEKNGAPIAGSFHGTFITDAGVTLSLRGAFSVDLEVTSL